MFNNFCLNGLCKNTALETNGMRSCAGTTSYNRFTEYVLVLTDIFNLPSTMSFTS